MDAPYEKRMFGAMPGRGASLGPQSF